MPERRNPNPILDDEIALVADLFAQWWARASTEASLEDQHRQPAEDATKAEVEYFTVDSNCLLRSPELRLDAEFYRPRVAQAIECSTNRE